MGDFAVLDPLLRPGDRGDRPRLDVTCRCLRWALGGVEADRALRHRGAEGAIPAADGQRPAARDYGPHRARRWIRPAGHAHGRRTGRRRLRDQRLEDVDHQRPHVRGGRVALQDRPGGATCAQRASRSCSSRRSPGFTVSTRTCPGSATRGSNSCDFHFDDCHVPADAFLGSVEGHGFAQMMTGLETGRIQVAGRAIGVARAAFDDAVRYAQEREAFGVADLATPVGRQPAGRHGHLDHGRPATQLPRRRLHGLEVRRADMEAGMAKLFCSEMAAKVVPRRDPRPRRPRLLHGIRRRALLPRRRR